MPLHCPSCGHENPDDANFCSSCGTRLGGDDERTITFRPPSDLGDQPSPPPVADPAAATPAEHPILVVERGPNAGSRFVLDQDVVRVGRHPDSDIFLDDITVSRRHVEIAKKGDRHVIRDVGSLNGTYVNRERIEEASLANSDVVQIGRFKLVFLAAAP